MIHNYLKSRQSRNTFLFSERYRTVPGPTQALFNGYWGSFPTKIGEGTLKIYLHLVLKLLMTEYTFLLYSLHIDI